MKEKVILMFSGGLDSRIALKMMQEQGVDVIALFFHLPFGTGCCDDRCLVDFTKSHNVKFEVIDCRKGKMLQEYLKVVKKAHHGKGSGVNPCVDCRLFMFTFAREYADKLGIETIVSGEVMGERPMSQMGKSLKLIEQKSGLVGRLLRPLSAKLLEPTNIEVRGVIDREKLEGIQGRRRERQMELAKKYNIDYPTPAGGCRLCEKALVSRFDYLFKRGLDDNEVGLADLGRHFVIDGVWIVVGRNELENGKLENFSKSIGRLVVSEAEFGFIGPTALVVDKFSKEVFDKVRLLLLSYSKKGSLKSRVEFEKYKL